MEQLVELREKRSRNDCGGCDVGGRVREENPGPTLITEGWGTLRVFRIADQERESEDGPPANQAAVTKAGPPAPVNL